jgi:hypothetical protein
MLAGVGSMPALVKNVKFKMRDRLEKQPAEKEKESLAKAQSRATCKTWAVFPCVFAPRRESVFCRKKPDFRVICGRYQLTPDQL